MSADTLHNSRMLMVVLGLVCVGGAGANADDMCFVYANSPDFWGVGTGYTLPENNTCRPLNGFEVFGGKDGSINGGITGTGCTDWNGAELNRGIPATRRRTSQAESRK